MSEHAKEENIAVSEEEQVKKQLQEAKLQLVQLQAQLVEEKAKAEEYLKSQENLPPVKPEPADSESTPEKSKEQVDKEFECLVLQLAKENPQWFYLSMKNAFESSVAEMGTSMSMKAPAGITPTLAHPVPPNLVAKMPSVISNIDEEEEEQPVLKKAVSKSATPPVPLQTSAPKTSVNLATIYADEDVEVKSQPEGKIVGGLYQASPLPTFSGDDRTRSTRDVLEYRSNMLAMKKSVNYTDFTAKSRLLGGSLTGTAKAWYNGLPQLQKDSYSFEQTLNALVAAFTEPLEVLTLKTSFANRVQGPAESVNAYAFALRDDAERIRALGNAQPADLPQRLLSGLRSDLYIRTLDRLTTTFEDPTRASFEEVLLAARHAETRVLMEPQASRESRSRIPVPAATGTRGAPIMVNNVNAGEIDPLITMADLIADEISKLNLQSYDRAETPASNTVNAIEYTGGRGRGGFRGRSRGGRGGYSNNSADSRPRKPCRVCEEANAKGDRNHWTSDCPLVKQAIAMGQGQMPPPPQQASVTQNAATTAQRPNLNAQPQAK
jgi:hypothetical protein